MLIRHGCEIMLNCQQDTPLICLLSAHRDHDAHIHVPEIMFTVPDMPVTNYVDLYGNRCRRLVAPSGDFKIWIDTTLEVDGVPDRVRGSASEIPVPELPAGCLIYLMGSRYCQTDLMSQTAWDLFGALPPAGAGCRRSAISCTGMFGSTISKRAPRARPLMSFRSVWVSVGIMPTLR